MIIESACNIAPLKLIDTPEREILHEAEFSRILASNCELVLSGLGVPLPHRIVKVEVPYNPGRLERCDVRIDNPGIAYFPATLNHVEHIESKYFRAHSSGGYITTRAENLWVDFRKLISFSKGFPYSVVLCEKDYLNVLPRGGLHGDCVRVCFDLSLPQQFSLWEAHAFAVGNTEPFSVVAVTGLQKFEVFRTVTQAFELKVENEVRSFRIYSFRLYLVEHACPGFDF